MNRNSYRSIWFVSVILAAALVLGACSSSEDSGPVVVPKPKTPLMIDDLSATAGSANSVTLAWTSPALADKAAIQYDLRYVAYGSESASWDAWTVAAPPTSASASGQEHSHVLTGLTEGQTYAFRMTASTDGTEWSPPSNITVATAAPEFDTTAPAAMTGVLLYGSTRSTLTVVWPFGGDDGIHGRASGYFARYSTAPLTPENWDAATPVPGPIYESDLPGMMETVIIGLDADQEYHVAVVAVDDVSHSSGLSNVVVAKTVITRAIYVNVEGTGDYPTIENAIDAAKVGDLILVGPGRYTWTNQATGDSLLGMINVPRDFTDFEVRSLAGPEATILDAEFHGKVMSVTGGSFGDPANRDFAGITIDGFTFTNGRALATKPNPDEGWSGAGLNLHLTDTVVRNCIFVGNEASFGGGLWIGGQGNAIVENCVFESNKARYGGGLYLINCEPLITVRDCVVRGNHATYGGGGVSMYNVTVTLENLLVVGNDSSDSGGGIRAVGLDPVYHDTRQMIGCTVADNRARRGSAIRLEDGSVMKMENCLLAFNTGSPAFSAVVQSATETGCNLVYGHDQGNQFPYLNTDLGGNIEVDPMFCDRLDYQLQSGSPCLPGEHPDGADCGLIGARGAGCGR